LPSKAKCHLKWFPTGELKLKIRRSRHGNEKDGPKNMENMHDGGKKKKKLEDDGKNE